MYKPKKSLGLKNEHLPIRVKKALGQNFIKSVLALKKMVEAGEVQKSDTVLEIGPGKGALTEKLLEKAGRVIAIEKDRELFEFLKIKFEKEIKTGNLTLLCEDILKISLPDLSRQDLDMAYKIIANIPYNITGAILKKFLTAKNQPERMVLMVQNEVAKRIMGCRKYQGFTLVKNKKIPRFHLGIGKESILSISVKAYGEPKIIMKVPARYFSPAPKVDSAIIAIKNISRKNFENVNLPGRQVLNEEKFWELIRAGFAHKRKKLSSNLRQIAPKALSESLRKNLGDKRAEELTLGDWINLVKTVTYEQK